MQNVTAKVTTLTFKDGAKSKATGREQRAKPQDGSKKQSHRTGAKSKAIEREQRATPQVGSKGQSRRTGAKP